MEAAMADNVKLIGDCFDAFGRAFRG